MDPSSLFAIPAPADAVFPEAEPPGLLGVLMLDTRFPRWPGDIGHPDTFRGSVRRLVVRGAFPREVVASAARLRAGGFAASFVAAARQLQAQGARAITTSCGFLALLQQDLQDAVAVPVVTSSLLQLPGLLQQEQQVGVLTISAASLGEEFLLAAGVPRQRLLDVVVQGMDPRGPFAAPILGNMPDMDAAAARADVLAAAKALQARAPQLRTVVLECTNLPPHADAIAAECGWRLASLLTAPQLQPWRR